jgi:hypothetical protein
MRAYRDSQSEGSTYFQEMLNEALGSVVSGRPIWRDALHACDNTSRAGAWPNSTRGLIHQRVQDFIGWGKRVKVWPSGEPGADSVLGLQSMGCHVT